MNALSRLLLVSASLAVPLATQSAVAGESGPAQTVNLSALGGAEGPPWLGSMAGEKLVAVDGSTLTLAPTEGGLSLALVSQNGAAQKSSFAFLSDKLGIISDEADAGHVTGFFRETDTGLEAQFADGRTESLAANTAGGISLTIHASSADAACTSWYPADHIFSAAERKAAVDTYAAQLGVGQHGKKSVRAAPTCVPAIKVVKNKISPSAAQSIIVTTHPSTARTSLSATISAKGSNAPALVPIVVRASDVHLIDAPGPTAIAAKLVVPAASIEPSFAQPEPKATAPAQAVPAATQTNATAQPSATQVAAASSVAGSGASDCLSVESDGANIGFRNRCSYGVQFAYCLQRASDPTTTCDAGTKTGAVSANAFAAVLLDANIKTADAEHDFRWVACSGNAGDVVAHLDRSEPPVGRCVRAGTL
jgi:hypothetical protein